MTSQQMLRKIHFTIYNYGKTMKYYEKIPQVLPSLVKLNPSSTELMEDYRKLSIHFNHPLFVNFIPTYDETSDCFETAWNKRFDMTKNILKKT